MSIYFRPINRSNWLDCCMLDVCDYQKKYVDSNAFSLAQAAYEEGHYPYGIYHDNTMVGFIMLSKMPLYYEILEFMIDKRYQGLHYGQKALQLGIDLAFQIFPTNDLYLSIHPDNKIAKHIYEKVGFINTHTFDGSEILFVLNRNHYYKFFALEEQAIVMT